MADLEALRRFGLVLEMAEAAGDGDWRADRVLAAFLVLSFHPLMAAFSLWFIGWSSRR